MDYRPRLPGGLPILESQRQRVAALSYFARHGQVGSVLLDLRASHLHRVIRLEDHAHVVEKFLRTKKDLHRLRATLQYQVSGRLRARGGNELQLLYHSLEGTFGGGIVFRSGLGKSSGSEEGNRSNFQEPIAHPVQLRAKRSHGGPSAGMLGLRRGKSNRICSSHELRSALILKFR